MLKLGVQIFKDNYGIMCMTIVQPSSVTFIIWLNKGLKLIPTSPNCYSKCLNVAGNFFFLLLTHLPRRNVFHGTLTIARDVRCSVSHFPHTGTTVASYHL